MKALCAIFRWCENSLAEGVWFLICQYIAKYCRCLTHICKFFLWNRLWNFPPMPYPNIVMLEIRFYLKIPEAGEWLKNENKGSNLLVLVKRLIYIPKNKRDSLILLHVDKFRMVIVLRNLLSSSLYIKLTLYTFHPV